MWERPLLTIPLPKHSEISYTGVVRNTLMKEVGSMKYFRNTAVLSVLLVSAVLLSSVMAGSSYGAWVLEVKGSATGQHNQQNLDITGGMSLENGTRIKAGSNATVRILIREQGIFTIKDGESYTVSADSRASGSIGKSFGNLMEMLAGRLQKNRRGPVTTAPSGGGADEGKHVRILPVFKGSSGPLLPMEGDLLLKEVIFQWAGKDQPEKYTFVLRRSDEKGEPLHEICRRSRYGSGEMTSEKISDSLTVCRFKYTKSAYNFNYGDYFMWGVSRTPNGEPDSYIWFHIAPYNKEKSILEKCSEIKSQLGIDEGSRSITYYLLCGALYEENGLYTDAWQSYQSAIDAVEPGNDRKPYEAILNSLSDKIRLIKAAQEKKSSVRTEPAIIITAQ